MPKARPRSKVIADLVTANRILADQGILDGYGHVSARCEDEPNEYYIGDATPPGNVRAKNVFRWTLENEPAGHEQPTYGERFIHGQIYRARPQVQAVVHCHAPELVLFGATGIPLRPIYHMAGFQGEEPLPVFEIRDEFGSETDMLIRSNEQGAALARALGERSAVLMRGHGATIVGRSVSQAVLFAVYAVINARIVMQALAAGATPTYINAAEGRGIARILGDGGRAWEYLGRLAGATGD
ncbi:MAG: class II aldolase/adducin family protein [Candidatus Lustribacter sp.]|jgi:HCOMODA/2-hydroxy-3-carboxy-muconic semialdehyde decarboxylase